MVIIGPMNFLIGSATQNHPTINVPHNSLDDAFGRWFSPSTLNPRVGGSIPYRSTTLISQSSNAYGFFYKDFVSLKKFIASEQQLKRRCVRIEL